MKHAHHTVLVLLVAIVLAPLPSPATLTETCLSGTAPDVVNDASQIRAVRALVDAVCVCSSFDASPGHTHINYVACATDIIETQVAAANLRTRCKGTVTRFYRNSTCGWPPSLQWVPCVQTSTVGRVTCRITQSSRCTGSSSVACPAYTTCIDAADTNGDLIIAAPGDNGMCAPTPTPTSPPTVTPTSTPTPTGTAQTTSDTFTFGSAGVIGTTQSSNCSPITVWDNVVDAYPQDMGEVCFNFYPNPYSGMDIPWQLGYPNNGFLLDQTPFTWGPVVWTSSTTYTQAGTAAYTGYGAGVVVNVAVNVLVTSQEYCSRVGCHYFPVYTLTGGTGVVTLN